MAKKFDPRQRRTFWTVVLGVFCSLIPAFSCESDPPTSTPACACGTNWIQFAHEKSKFTAQFPSQPKQMFLTNQTKLGPVVIQMFIAETPKSGAFTVLKNDLPPESDISDEDRILKSGLNEALKKTRGIADYVKEIKIDGLSGREWRFQTPERMVVYQRVFLHRNALYQATSAQPKTNACEIHVRQFLNSFQIAR